MFGRATHCSVTGTNFLSIHHHHSHHPLTNRPSISTHSSSSRGCSFSHTRHRGVEVIRASVAMDSMAIKPPSHPTYDLKAVINLALAEDAGDREDYEEWAVIRASVAMDSVATKPHSHPTYDLEAVINLALAEDARDGGDVTCLATVPMDMEVEAYFLAKENGIIAGISLAEMIFNEVDPMLKVEWSQKDGDYVHKGLQFGKVSGKAHKIVVAERVVLNFMQRMSGIATLTKAMADAAHPARILETRKTAPGLRLVDKWAVLIGGGHNHRMGLFDMVMIKDNHISIAGGVTDAIKSVDKFLEKNNLQMGVEIETRTLEEVKEVLSHASQAKTSVTRIMLDNMVVPLENGDVDVTMLKQAVQLINGSFETEASGNVTLETVHKIGQSGVTYISSGALTHSVKALDISLKIDMELALKVGVRTMRA